MSLFDRIFRLAENMDPHITDRPGYTHYKTELPGGKVISTSVDKHSGDIEHATWHGNGETKVLGKMSGTARDTNPLIAHKKLVNHIAQFGHKNLPTHLFH